MDGYPGLLRESDAAFAMQSSLLFRFLHWLHTAVREEVLALLEGLRRFKADLRLGLLIKWRHELLLAVLVLHSCHLVEELL